MGIGHGDRGTGALDTEMCGASWLTKHSTRNRRRPRLEVVVVEIDGGQTIGRD